MNNKTHKRINGSFAIYYGIGALLLAVGCVVALLVWVYEVVFEAREAEWQTPLLFIVLAAVLGGIGYALYRTGYEEIEEK
jgi:drug/metabolite transporter (DMT)-like permease